jgi:hypothetical protein
MSSMKKPDISSNERCSVQNKRRVRRSHEIVQCEHSIRDNRSTHTIHDGRKEFLPDSRSESITSSVYSRRRPVKRRIMASIRRSLDTWIILAALGLILYRAHHVVSANLVGFADENVHFRIPIDPTEASILGSFTETLSSLTVEIFSAPKPFRGTDNSTIRRAIESWSRLQPKPKITLLGGEAGYFEAARDFGLNIEPRVDKTFLGVPLFNAMVDRANRSAAQVAVVINGDVLLYDDFMQTIRKVVASFQDFLIVGARYDVDELPADAETDLSRIRSHVVKHGMLHTYGGMDGKSP